jgi:hypothetical protein
VPVKKVVWLQLALLKMNPRHAARRVRAFELQAVDHHQIAGIKATVARKHMTLGLAAPDQPFMVPDGLGCPASVIGTAANAAADHLVLAAL